MNLLKCEFHPSFSLKQRREKQVAFPGWQREGTLRNVCFISIAQTMGAYEVQEEVKKQNKKA